MKKNQKALLSFTLAGLVFSAGCAFFSENELMVKVKIIVDVYRCSVDPQSGSACRGTG